VAQGLIETREGQIQGNGADGKAISENLSSALALPGPEHQSLGSRMI
jgi:hypothetical protein